MINSNDPKITIITQEPFFSSMTSDDLTLPHYIKIKLLLNTTIHNK